MNKWILLLCGALAACGESKQEEKRCQRIDMVTILEQDEESIALAERAKTVRLIPLETNDSTLIGWIASPVFIQDEKILIQHTNISVFDLDGKFICNVGSKGGGPEEYNSIGNLWADAEGIYVLDSQKWIKTFGWDGKWIRTQAIPQRGIREAFPLSDNRIAGYIQNISGSEPYRFHIFRDTTVLQSIPYAKTFPAGTISMVFYDECKLFETPEGIFFKEMFNDTIFAITDKDELRPVWNVDLGKYRVAEDARYTLTDPRQSLFQNSANLSVIGLWNDELFFTAYFNNKTFLLSYNEKEGKVHNLSYTYPDHSFAFSEKKTFIPSNITPDGKYMVGYETQENDENPVIILAERK